MPLDILGYYNANKDFYGDASLEDVAKDAYQRDYKDKYPDYDTWKKVKGIDSIVKEDTRKRNPSFTDRLRGATNDPGSRGVTGFLKDSAIDVAKGVVGLGESAVGLMDIPTGNLVGDALSKVGYDPKGTNEFLSSGYSEGRQRANKAVEDARGFFDTTTELLSNPSALVGSILESAPGTIGIAGVARGAAMKMLANAGIKDLTTAAGKKAASEFLKNPAVITKLTALSAGAEGVQSTGSIQEQARQAGREWTETAPYSIAAGIGTAGIAFLTSKIPGFQDAEARAAVIGLIQGTKGEALLESGKRIAKSFFKEGVLEEMPQSAQEQVFTNLALGLPWDQGVAEAAGTGMLVGAVQGGFMSAGSEMTARARETADIPRLKAGADIADIIHTGIITGKGPDGIQFTPEVAIGLIHEGQKQGIYDETDLDRFKERYPQLRDGLNGVVAESLKDKINQVLESTEPRPDSISALKKDMEKMKAQREEDVPAFEPEGNIVDLTNQDLSGLNILEDKWVNDNGQVQTETAIKDVSPTADLAAQDSIKGTEAAAGTAPVENVVPEKIVEPAEAGEGISFHDGISPSEINQKWGDAYAKGDEITKKNSPIIESLQKERSQLPKNDKSGRKAEIDKEITTLKDEARFAYDKAEIDFNAATEDYVQKIINRVKTEGIAVEDEDVYETVNMMLDGRSHEANSGKTWSEPLTDQVLSELKAIAEEREIEKQKGKTPSSTLPAPLSQTDAATVGEEAKAETSPFDTDITGKPFNFKIEKYKGQPVVFKSEQDKKHIYAMKAVDKNREIVHKKIAQVTEAEKAGNNAKALVSMKEVVDLAEKSNAVNDAHTKEFGKYRDGFNIKMMRDKIARMEADAKTEASTVDAASAKRKAAIDRYTQQLRNQNPNITDEYINERIRQIDEKDNIALRKIMNGINPGVNRLFTALTGLPAKTQKETDASLRSMNPERWDNWQKETKAAFEKQEAERAAAAHKRELDSLLNVQVRHDGEIMTYREHYDKAIAAGYTSIEEEKKGVASVYYLSNPQEGSFYTVKKKIVADYLKGRIEELKAEQKTEAPRPEVEKPLTEDDLRSLTYDSIVAYEATKGVGNLKEFTYKRGKYKAINKKDGREHNYVVQIRNDGQMLVTDKNVTEDQINKDLLTDWGKLPEHIKTIINREWPDLNQTQKNSLAMVMNGNGKLSPTGMVVISGGRVVRRALELFPDAEGKSLDYLANKLREFAQASLSPKQEEQKVDEKTPAPEEKPIDLSTKSTGDLVKDMFDIINDHIGERGSISTKEVDETLYQKLKPYLLEIVKRAKAKALDARAYLFGAVDAMPDGKAKDIYEAAARRYADEQDNEHYEKAAAKNTETIDKTTKKDYNIIKEGEKNEHSADGSAGAGTLESDKSGNLSADGRGQGARGGKRGSSQADNEGNQDLDAGGLDGSGSVAGKSSPIHLQDSGTDGEVLPAESSAVDETPASEPRTIQLSGINPGNYRITEEDDIGSGTRGQKIDRNIAAIRLIKKLDQEHRYPTKEEQSVLAKYVGWGGLKSVFDKTSSKAQDQRAREELESLLTKEEYLEAFVSMKNAHYTSPQVIKSIYKVLSHFGLTGGNILEPTYGVGNFIGLAPDDIAAASKFYGAELDIITAKIGQYLYPDSQLIQSGFQNAEFPYGKFDAFVGNPPFGDERIADTRKSRQEINRFKIHNYCIAKSGLHLKPGGIGAAVVTSRFLDTADPEARDFLAKQFKFLGAIRLPNDAFAKNAGTEVTTDLVFFQRLMPGEKPDMSADWLTTGATITNKDGEKITLNKYFAERPELMLGEPSMKGTMYGGAWREGGKGEFTLNKREGEDIESLIDGVIESPLFSDLKDVAKNNNDKLDAAALSLIPNKEDVAVGGFFMDKDNIFMREDNDEYGNPTYTRLTPKTKWTEKQLLGETRYLRIKGMLELRAKAYELVNAERFDLGNIEHLRKQLNFLYDNFVKNYGFINESSNFSLMSDDIKIEFGLEINFKKEITKAKAKSLGVKPSPASAEKATLLKERMFYPEKEILYAKDAADGYNISLFQKGKLDIDYIAKLTGTAKESVIADLSKDGLIYQDPDTKEWIQEDEYLSGNVKAKYKKVEGKEGFEKNAKDLKKVFPADVPTEGIFANPGATWIPEKVYEQFGHFIGVENPSVSIYRNNGQFSMRSSGQRQNDINVAWLNSYYSISDIFNAVANNKVLIAWDGTGDDRTQNKEQTAELATIVQGVRSTFSDWIFADDARASELTKIYNATQNTHAKRKNDGTHLHTVGASPAVILRNTQRDAAWRIIQSKRVLLDHCVGAGKTYTIITGVQERVRMGLTRKAMIAVPNHLVGQWAADYMRLYPGARILAATKKDFSKPNRRRLFARIATGKYDAIIVGHSSFGFIPLETESLTNLMMEEIAQLEAAHAQADADGNKRLVKTLANRIAKKREKINELLGRPRDNVTTFEAMGIDHLVVDESHEFKNLEYSSAMQNITGMGNPMGSKRAFDMYAKIRWLTAQKDYALNFATGTPISNSLVEMYALLRYMNRDALYARGVDAFDAWANTYASIEPRIEYTASQKLKQRTVMATFNNLPELLQLYEEFADIVTMPDLKRIYAEQIRERNARTGGNESEEFPVPKVKDGGRTLDVADPSPEQVEYVDYLVARAERLEEAGRSNDPKIDNHLWIMSDARKMALDIRLVDPTAKESPNNKINRATKRIKEIYDRTEKDKGAQLVFCDLSTPSGSAQKNATVFIREALKKAHLETDARTKAILDSLSTYQEKWGYIRNRLEAEIEAISDHSHAETEQYMKRREEIEDYLEKVTDDVAADLTTADTGFSVYDEMKSKLIMMGIPEGEIKFIHDANTEQQKEDLFAMVNSGQVRVLLGSSQKMGAGMNVQERLVALHHMDAPWRPSDVEQREGRLVRQGNKLYSINPAGFKVEIKAYSTSNTFDAVMWQILARKGGMLDDFRSGRRTVEEVSMDGANYSEFMAETTGNPAFKEKFKLEGDIKALRAIKNRTTTRLRSSQQSIDYNKDARIKSQSEIEKRDKIINDLKGQSTFTFEGKQYKDNAKDLVAKEANEITEYNARVNKEYNTAIDAATTEALDKVGVTQPERPSADYKYKKGGYGLREIIEYEQRVRDYNEFWDSPEVKKVTSEAVKGIKKPTNKHFHSTKLAKSDKSGVIAAALKMVDEINALDDGETFSYQLGNTEIEIKKTESGWTNNVKVEDRTRLWDYVVTADGMFLDRLKEDKDFDERNIWNLLNVEAVNNRMTEHRRDAASYIERMDRSDEVSKHTLESLKFKDDEKLQRMEARYQDVLNEVAVAEFEIASRRAATGNKYIQNDRPRFPAGVWNPHGDDQAVLNNQSEAGISQIDNVDLDALREQRKEIKEEIENGDYEDDDLIIKFAELARAEALLSQKGDGKIDTAQANLTEAVKGWDEFHEGEEYPYEIKLAQKIIESIRSGQGRLFKGQQYSVQSEGNETVTMPTLSEVQEVFKGQEVQEVPGGFMIRTNTGQFVTIAEVNHISMSEANFKIGYGRTELHQGEVLSGGYAYNKELGTGVIKLRRGTAGKWTLAHESVHFMEDIGVLNSNEINLLQRHIKNLERDGKFTTVNKEDIGGEEDRANFLADALTKEPKGLLGRILNKIQDFIDKLVNAFGIRTVRGIARDVKSGKVYEGGLTGQSASATRYSVTKDKGTANIPTKENPVAEAGNPFKHSVIQEHVYHGTNVELSEFSDTHRGNIFLGNKAAEQAHWFTSNEVDAEHYAESARLRKGGRKNVIKTYLDIRNPRYVTGDELYAYREELKQTTSNKLDEISDEINSLEFYPERIDPLIKKHKIDIQTPLNKEGEWEAYVNGNDTGYLYTSKEDAKISALDNYLEAEKRKIKDKIDRLESPEELQEHIGDFIEETKEQGYDGIIITGEKGDPINYGVFSSKQIKIIPNPSRPPEVGGQFQRREKYSIRKSQDPPTSRDPKVLNLYLKDETDALIQTMMNKLHPPHMTWLETILKSPEWFGHPQIQKIVKLFMRDRNEIYHETFNDLNMADDIDAPESTVTEAAKALKNKGLSLADRMAGKVSPEYQRLQEIIDEGDTSWKRNTSIPLDRQIKEFEKHIRQQGTTEETIRVWKLYRQSYDKALDLQTAQLRQMIDEITEEANFRGEKPDLNELRQTLKGALAQMEEWRGFYAPRLRESGNWKVQAYKEHGPMKENREWYREHRGSELSARRLANKMQREGWKIYSVGEVERIPETIYQDVNAAATAKLIDAALEKLSKQSAMSSELTLKFNEEVLREVSNAIKARGFRSTMIQRGEKVVRGFIEDPIQRHLQYINSLSGGISKARVARLAMAEMLGEKFQGQQVGGIDPVTDPKAFQVAQNYIEEQLRNVEPIDRMIGLAKSIATFKFLGFNLRSLAVNTTAIITTAPAAIHQYALNGKGSMMGIIKELAVSGKDYGALMTGKKLADADEQAFIDEVHKKGWDDAQYTREALGEISKTHSRIWSSMMDGSMYLFGKSEKWNRGTTMLAAYRLARKQGMGHGEASELAKEASDKAHGVYGKSTMPMWAQGTNPAAKLGQLFYVYQKFGHNYLQMLYDMGLKKHNIKGAMFAFLSPLVLAGGAALPFKDAIFSFAGFILKALFGEDRDPEKWVWDEIRKHLGNEAERIGRHGLTGAMGVDISGSLSAGVGIPKNFIDLTGAIGGVATEIEEAGESLRNKQYGKAAEHLLPTGLANPLRAMRESEQGVTTRNNRRVWDEKGRPYKPSEGATIARAVGFRPTDQAVLSERTWEGHRQQADFADKRNAIYERYRAWALGKRDREEYKEIVKDVQKYNKTIRENRIQGVSPITSQSLQNQARRLAAPSKNERALLQN